MAAYTLLGRGISDIITIFQKMYLIIEYIDILLKLKKCTKINCKITYYNFLQYFILWIVDKLIKYIIKVVIQLCILRFSLFQIR